MLVDSVAKFRIDRQRFREEYMSSKPESYLSPVSKTYSQYNNQDIKRPLKTNHSDLSFKGLSLSLYKQLDKTYSKTAFLEFADKYLGGMGKELLEDITIRHASSTRKLISIDPNDPDKIIIHKKTIPHLAWDGLIYPFKILPGDILNGVVEFLGKIGFKKFAQKTLQKPMFKKIRQRSKLDAKVNSLTGLITYRDMKMDDALSRYAKSVDKKVTDLTQAEKDNVAQEVDNKLGSNVFQSELKQFDPKSGNYDTKHERALNRLVSGLPPALFLANDAYNLSRMMDDDSKAADHERKVRFRQEVSRILTSGYLTLITMGAFQKFINKSKAGIVLTTGITVLVTEMFSRLSNGKHIVKLSPEKAREINEKSNAPEAKIKPLSFLSDEEKAKANKQQVPATGTQKSKEQQKPLLSFGTLVKASAFILTLGFGFKGLKNLSFVRGAAVKYFEKLKITNSEKFNKLGISQAFDKAISDLKIMDPKKYANMSDEELKLLSAVKIFENKVLYKPFTSLYKNMTTTKYVVDEVKFNKVVEVLRQNGFGALADKYESVGRAAAKTVDGKKIIDFGTKDKKVKPLVNFVIAPFKFMWNTITLPYWMIDEKLLGIFRKAKPKSAPKDIDALARSFDKICKQALAKKFSSSKFKDYVQVNLLKAFNVDSLSSVSNAELSNLAKTAASVATIWFLMTDNYNMVMLKSNGNDKQGADTKFKERFVQEGSRLFYQTLLIDLFNSTFRNQYNASLLGMSWVTLADTTLGEILTRSSVGTPIKSHTRDELLDIETKQNNSAGFMKKYYNFMQRLTGKRSIKSYEVAPKNPNQKAQIQQPQAISIPEIANVPPVNNKIIFRNQDNKQSVLEQMIKG